jgi:hypothetical protein
MHGNFTLQVGKREICLPIASIGCAQQSKQSLVLIDWQYLAVALCPSFWCEVETEYSDF